MPPPNQATSPLRAAADLLGWTVYLSVMGGGFPDLTLFTFPPAPVTETDGHYAQAEGNLSAQDVASPLPRNGDAPGDAAQVLMRERAPADLAAAGSF